MKIGIIGAGNIGTALAADLAQRHCVKLYSSRAHKFSGKVKYVDSITNSNFDSQIEFVSDRYEDVVCDADIVFVCLPTYLIRATAERIALSLNKPVPVCFVPGAGGVEFLAKSLVDVGCPIAGLDRVPYVSRLVEYGKCVSASKKRNTRIAFLRNGDRPFFNAISTVLDMPATMMKSFLSVSLTPTLHISRLYDLYGDIDRPGYVPSNPLFYAEWRDSASLICLELDKELHSVCNGLLSVGLDTSEVVPYTAHYESPTAHALTLKLHTIQSLSRIYGPIVAKGNKFMLDINSRYFTESFPYRLALVKGLADILGQDVPLSDKVLMWYSRLAGKEYFVNGNFCGKDALECSMPQNFGVSDIESLVAYYSKKK
jgi:hypothetical protein